MKKLLVTAALAMAASSVIASEVPILDNIQVEKSAYRDSIGLFGQQVVGIALSYVRDVRDVDGKKVVDVVILDKLCHVTVVDHSDGLKAEGFACDEGNYSENRD
ncbi:hypothetical protein [Vibrio sp. WXL210]|uniref:hypothetical protein n=1 Tax=Vibrio sp. WXL210 TaxID=3450709 RepID=UPI003EC5BC77